MDRLWGGFRPLRPVRRQLIRVLLMVADTTWVPWERLPGRHEPQVRLVPRAAWRAV